MNYYLDNWWLIGAAIRFVWRQSKWRLLKRRWRSASLAAISLSLNVMKIYWIKPEMIQYCSLNEFDIYNFRGKVIRGDWDSLIKRFDELDIYIAFKQVFENGIRWENTSFYKNITKQIRNGGIPWGCSTIEAFDKRCETLEMLYHKIKTEGYKSQKDLLPRGSIVDPLTLDDEITVSIGRYGDILFSNGAHRLAIAKLLNIARIPVKIAVRHQEWVNFKRELYSYSQCQAGKLYQPVIHPDLAEIPSYHRCLNRYKLIRRHVTSRTGTVLDIGANLGYFCHKFEEDLYDCYAVEVDKTNLYFLHKLKRAMNKSFKIIPRSVLDLGDIINLHFDIVLALNIFHHFLKRKETYLKFIDLLHNLNVKEMFFEPHSPYEAQMDQAYKNYTNKQFIDLLISESCMTNAEVIGEADDRRKIYRLY